VRERVEPCSLDDMSLSQRSPRLPLGVTRTIPQSAIQNPKPSTGPPRHLSPTKVPANTIPLPAVPLTNRKTLFAIKLDRQHLAVRMWACVGSCVALWVSFSPLGNNVMGTLRLPLRCHRGEVMVSGSRTIFGVKSSGSKQFPSTPLSLTTEALRGQGSAQGYKCISSPPPFFPVLTTQQKSIHALHRNVLCISGIPLGGRRLRRLLFSVL